MKPGPLRVVPYHVSYDLSSPVTGFRLLSLSPHPSSASCVSQAGLKLGVQLVMVHTTTPDFTHTRQALHQLSLNPRATQLLGLRQGVTV